MNYNIINHKFSCNNCNECSFNINDPIIYKDLSYENLMKIVLNICPYTHTSKISIQESKIKCNGNLDIIHTINDPWKSLSYNKIIIKEVLELWCSINSISYSPPEIQYQKIIGIIYTIDLIGKYSTFRDIILSFCYEKDLI